MRLFFLCLTFVFLAHTGLAQTNNSTVFRFLDVSPTARSAALGGSHVALYNADFSLLHLNPAYLNSKSSGSISASYINFLGDANMGFTSGTYTFGRLGTVGAAIRFVGYGEFDHLDEHGNQLSTFQANDLAFTGAYSIPITPLLTAGAGLDFIYSSYFNYKSSAVAVSGGLFYQNPETHFSAGVAFRNMGTQLTAYRHRHEPLPFDVSIGITKKPEAFPFQLSLTLNKLTDWDVRTAGETEKPDLINNIARHVIFGGEAKLGQNAAFRLGYDHYLHEQTKTGKDFDLAGIAFGVGFTVKSIVIDFSRNSFSSLGGITRLSIKTQLD